MEEYIHKLIGVIPFFIIGLVCIFKRKEMADGIIKSGTTFWGKFVKNYDAEKYRGQAEIFSLILGIMFIFCSLCLLYQTITFFIVYGIK